MTIDLTTELESLEAGLAPRFALGISQELDLADLGDSYFAATVLRRGIPHTSYRAWATTAESLDPVLGHAVSTVRWRKKLTAFLELGEVFGQPCVALVDLRQGWMYANVGAGERGTLSAVEDWLLQHFPKAEQKDDRAWVTFWSGGGGCADSTSRSLAVPTWEEIRRNYPRGVAARLDLLMRPEFRPAEGGRLVLWHGRPGTGKTYALRALARQWRDWCEFHYVTDPEVFFGARTSYMIEILLNRDEEQEGTWRLLVLEDTGELLAADAKEQTGQGLSRLLNLVDGIIGQGLRVFALVTTNEPLKRLHPAVARPGRCIAKVKFEPFSAEEAHDWLGEEDAAGTAATLATLYARAGGRDDDDEEPRPFGFTV